MKKQNTIRKISAALQKTIISIGILHLGIVAVQFVQLRDLQTINAFHILGLQILYPSLENGGISFILSWVCIGVIFFFFLNSIEK